MRSSTLLTAAFAGCALASPIAKRDTVVEIDTVYDVVYVTQWVTETAGASAPAAEVTSTVVESSPATSSVVESAPTSSSAVEAAATTSVSMKQNNFYENRYSWSSAWTSTYAFSTEVVSSAAAVETSTSIPVVESTSVYVAPSTSTSVYVAVSSSLSAYATASTSSAAEVSNSNLYSNSLNALKARAGTPTCNPNNVRYFKSYFPSPTAYCKRWQSAMPSPTNKIASGLNKKQTNNICSCVLAGTYVSNTPLTSIKTSATSATATAQATTYQERVVLHHNVHRANHSAPNLVWNQTLANTAQKIGESCVYAHDTTTDGGNYGQNIAAGVQAANISAVITDLFYNGEVNYFANLYNQANPDMTNFENWGHFSQIVWKATTQVGCATVDCSSSGLANAGSSVPPYFTVCNYKTPGNYEGEYATNIGSSLNKATVEWDYGL